MDISPQILNLPDFLSKIAFFAIFWAFFRTNYKNKLQINLGKHPYFTLSVSIGHLE